MYHLPLSRERDSQELIMAGTGRVALRIGYDDVLGRGGQGLVLRGQVTDLHGSLLKEVGAVLTCWEAYYAIRMSAGGRGLQCPRGSAGSRRVTRSSSV